MRAYDTRNAARGGWSKRKRWTAPTWTFRRRLSPSSGTQCTPAAWLPGCPSCRTLRCWRSAWPACLAQCTEPGTASALLPLEQLSWRSQRVHVAQLAAFAAAHAEMQLLQLPVGATQARLPSPDTGQWSCQCMSDTAPSPARLVRPVVPLVPPQNKSRIKTGHTCVVLWSWQPRHEATRTPTRWCVAAFCRTE